MFGTSKMLLEKSSTVRGRLKNENYMGSTTQGISGTDNAIGDMADLEVTRSFMKDAYRVNDWIRAIVDRGTERAAQVEIFPIPLGAKIGTKEGQLSKEVRKKMENVMSLFMKPNNDGESFDSLKTKVYRDVLVYDEAGMQIVNNSRLSVDKSGYSLYANVTGEEIFVNPRRNGTLPKNRAYLQLRDGADEIASWGKDEFLNFIRHSRAGYANGFSPIETAVTSIMGDFEAMNYNLKFFENNARPDFAFIFENLGFGKGNNALEKARTWYMQRHQGQPHIPLFMGSEKGTVKMQELKVTQKDMGFFEWQMMLLNRIMAVYGMQPMIIGMSTTTEATGKLEAEMQGSEFKKNTVIPLINMFTNVLNSGLIWSDANFNYDDIYITSTNLDIDDEKKQAEIDEKYLDRGVITINQVRNRLQMPPVPWGYMPFVPLNYAPYDTLIKYQQSKIASNVQRASSDGIDNNVKVPEDSKNPKDTKKDIAEYVHDSKDMMGLWSALYASQNVDKDPSEIYRHYEMFKSKLPTGTEKVDKTVINGIVEELISERDTFYAKTYSYGNFSHSKTIQIANNTGLEWKNILD